MEIEYLIKEDKKGGKQVVMQRAYKTCPKIDNYAYGYGTLTTFNKDGSFNLQSATPIPPEDYIKEGFKRCSKKEAIDFAQDPTGLIGDEMNFQELDKMAIESYNSENMEKLLDNDNTTNK
jgi:hypothetical protein